MHILELKLNLMASNISLSFDVIASLLNFLCPAAEYISFRVMWSESSNLELINIDTKPTMWISD